MPKQNGDFHPNNRIFIAQNSALNMETNPNWLYMFRHVIFQIRYKIVFLYDVWSRERERIENIMRTLSEYMSIGYLNATH